jgi:hypothetical protein
MKECTRCHQTKSLSEFTFDKAAGKAGRHKSWCKRCAADHKRAKDRENPEKARAYVLMYHYGITPERYESMLEAQGGACAVCHQPERQIDTRYGALLKLAVDHNHACCPGKKTCGKCLRGLVCKRCNQTLGLVEDDPELLSSMVKYLTKGESDGTGRGSQDHRGPDGGTPG